MDNALSRSLLHISGRLGGPALSAALLCVLAVGLIFHPFVRAAVLIPDADLPAPAVADFVVADVTGSGDVHLVAVGEDGLFVLAPDDEATWIRLLSLPPLPAPATSVAVGDFIGDGVPSIAVGTAQAGAIYLLRWTGGHWAVVAQSVYLWAPVSSLAPARLLTDGSTQLVAANENGVVTVFNWQDTGLVPVWQRQVASGRAPYVAAASLTGDGRQQLIIADDEGSVSVWSWPMTEPQARAFVWGTPTALAVADVTGGRPEVIVSTDERLLYRFTWEDGRLMQAMSPLHDARLPFDYMTPIRWSGHLSDYLLAHNLSGVGVWRLSSSSIALIDEGWASPPLAAALWPGTDAILIAERTGERSGTLRAWARRPSNFLDFTVDGVPAALSDPPLSQQDQIMLSARDWADVLGLRLFWDASRLRLTVVGPRTYAILTVGERAVTLPAGTRAASLAPVLRDGRTYVPPEFPTWFGATYEWDPRRRTLSVSTGN